jgi:alpha-ketoglutarate-dependent taurine dioxygenase
VSLSYEQLSPALGVEVTYDLRAPMPPQDQHVLIELLDQHQLLLFRGQHIERSDQARVVSYVGNVIDPTMSSPTGTPVGRSSRAANSSSIKTLRVIHGQVPNLYKLTIFGVSAR